MRNKSLKYADLVITECNLYQKELNAYLIPPSVINVYWPREIEEKVTLNTGNSDGRIHICYLGSINHIIDINFMVDLLSCIQKHKPINLHIIGDGENKAELLRRLDLTGINTIFYGSIYEESEKMRVLSACDYGLNIMKRSVCVGITMKSVDYMYAGLKLINNIKGDTWELIEKHEIGYNCDYGNLEMIANKIAKERINKESKEVVRQCYLCNFSKSAYENSMKKCLEIIEKMQEK